MKKITRVITRGASDRFSKALSHHGSSATIDLALARLQHNAYMKTLERMGAVVECVPSSAEYPDCCFIEDCALVAGGVALITQPGAPSRRGETTAVKEHLQRLLPTVEMLGSATLDGGDCLITDTHIFVGLSKRTNYEGYLKVKEVFRAKGFEVLSVEVEEHLHLKCVCSYLGDGTVLLAEGTVNPTRLGPHKIVTIPPEETYAANCVAFNGYALIPHGFPKTKESLIQNGFNTFEIDTSEFKKADGSLTCLSLLL